MLRGKYLSTHEAHRVAVVWDLAPQMLSLGFFGAL
jgi:hypothetical protein